MVKRHVNMHIEGVPNPDAMRFVLENGVLLNEPYEFISFEDATHSPLARKLMLLRYVERVLINRNFITILKKAELSPPWDEIIYELKMMIIHHLEENEPILFVGRKEIQHKRSDDVVAEIITNVLDAHIRPAAQEDGGDILFDSYSSGVLRLSMHGACHRCPYSIKTIKDGVEPLLTNMIPEVQEVIATQWEENN